MEKIMCKWWKLTHNKLPLHYHGTHSVVTYQCTNPVWCSHNVADERLGGCTLRGDLTDLKEEDRP